MHTIAFYNLENLFDTEDDPNINDEEYTPANGWTIEKYNQKLQNLEKVISEIGTNDQQTNSPTVLGACELENRKVLEDLVAMPKLAAKDYGVVHFDSPDGRGIDVGFLYQKKHFKPTIVLAEGDDGLLTGSARTINNFDLHESLTKCADLLVKFGGHVHAAGLTIEKAKVEEFKSRFEGLVAKGLRPEDLAPTESVDLEINFTDIFTDGESLQSIPRLKRVLDQLEPHGPGNMKPVFLSTNVYAVATRVLKEQHLKLTLVQPHSDLQLEAIGFNMADKMDLLGSGLPVDIIYTLEGNTWKDRTTLQLNIKDIRETI